MEQKFKKQSLQWHISKITDNIDEVRNLFDTILHQNPDRNRLQHLEKLEQKKEEKKKEYQ